MDAKYKRFMEAVESAVTPPQSPYRIAFKTTEEMLERMLGDIEHRARVGLLDSTLGPVEVNKILERVEKARKQIRWQRMKTNEYYTERERWEVDLHNLVASLGDD